MRGWWFRVMAVLVVGGLGGITRPAAADEIHIVEPGETVAAIANTHGITLDTVITTNAIADVGNLRIGERLVIPDGEGVVIPGVTPYQQQRSLSCEYASVYIATTVLGEPIFESDSIAATPLDPNPHRGFRGDIDGEWGNTDDYGVYAEALVPNLDQHGYAATVSYGADAAKLRAQIDAGRPTIVWLGYWGETGTYETDASGWSYKLVPGYHNVVVYGYDESGVYVANPGNGTLQTYGWESFLTMWSVLDGMALAISPA